MKNVHEIEIELKGSEWTKILDETFNKKKKDVKIDGFRKGSVTKEIYIKKLGIESLYPDAVDAALPVAYEKCLKENDLVPVIEPKVDIKHICDDCVTFSFTITTRPEVTLGEYKNLGIKKEEVTVSAEEVAEEVKRLQDRAAEIVVKENGEIVEGNTAIINFEGYVDGKKLEGGSGENYPLEIGSNTFIPGFESGLIGLKTGEEKELNLKFPDEYVDELKGKDVLFKVKIVEIKERILPEVNAELFADLGYEDIKTKEEFEARIKEDIKKRKEAEVEDKYIDATLDKAVSNMKVELNNEIIDDEIDRMVNQYKEQLSYQGLSLDQYFEFTKTTLEDLKSKMRDEAIKRIKSRYLLECVAEKENITIKDEDAEKNADELCKQYQMTKEEFIKSFGGIEMLKYDMRMREALEIIRK